MKTRIALFAAAAALALTSTLGLAPAIAQQAPRAGDVAPSKPGDKAPPPIGSSMVNTLPAQDESKMPKELYVLPPVSKAYQPKKTPWGDPDLRGMFPIDAIGGLSIQRTPAQGKRVWLSDAEYKVVSDRMEKFKNAAKAETQANRLGNGNWVEMTGAGRRTSMLIDPDNGRLPDMTEYGKKMQAMGRSSWVPGQTFDWVTDFDSWDRCISRGFPASMLPFRYNNGVQILQSPGYVVINLEMIHDARIIPISNSAAPPKAISSWMGESRGHWEGNTLVVETTNIRPGAAPINAATIGGPQPAWNTVPMSPDAKVIERFTLINKDTLTYEMTYSDPKVWTKPFTLRVDWPRNEKYEFFEYACHEGDEQVRNYIIANRALRAKIASGEASPADMRRSAPNPANPNGGEAPAAQQPRAEAAQPQRQ
jgi:hypothetical protein